MNQEKREKINPSLEKSMNNAIEFLAVALNSTGHNSKPILLHSIRVGFHLYDMRYNQEIIQAGLLHDILEDTETTEELIDKFGTKITRIVAATSFNPLISDRTKQFQDMFNRCVECGKETLIIKTVDLMDNSYYIRLVDDKETKTWLLFKLKNFIEISKEILEKEDIWNQLNKRYYILLKELNIQISDMVGL